MTQTETRDNLPDVPKPATVERLCDVDISALLARVRQLGDAAWMSEDERKENRFAVFHSTRHIIFRFIEGNIDPRMYYDGAAWMMWRPLVAPIFARVAACYDYLHPEMPKAMLARLAAGQQIDRHTDGLGSNVKVHKIHVPLITNPGALFCVGDQDFHLEAGAAYEVNNIAPHAAKNDGDKDRIHLIFEVFDRQGAASGQR